MIEKILNWFLKPYPFPTTYSSKFLISIGFGSFIFLFLLIFKPFGFYQLQNNTAYYAFIYGLITLSVLLINLLIFPLVFTKFFNPDKWTIYKMLLYVLEIILTISFANWYFSNHLKYFFTHTNNSFLFFIIVTFLIGIFPILIYVYITEKNAYNKHKNIADSISKTQKTNSKSNRDHNPEITIVGENKKEQLTVALNELLYISSEKNYASIFHLQNKKITETLIRTSLNKIELQLSKYKAIVRCHKSYIVNTNQVEKIQGNARSYLLQIPNLNFLIPVSRSFPKEFLFTLVK